MDEHTHAGPDHEHTHDHAHTHDHKKEHDLPTLTVPGAIVLNGFIIGLCVILSAVMLGGHFGTKPAATAPAAAGTTLPAQTPDIKKVKTAGEPTIGNPEAKVVVAYWSDYQCPFCKVFETTTFQTLLEKYVQSGKVAFVFKDFAFLGDDSKTAAVYARAVWALYPDKYFAWREAMYNAQDGENTGFGDTKTIAKLTATVPGIDEKAVEKNISDKFDAYEAAVQADRDEAASFGVQGTPSFIVGTKLISGNQPIDQFTAALDAQLKK